MKKQRNLSRKQRAIKGISRLIALVLISNLVFHTGYILPLQSFWEHEQRLGAGELTVLERRWEPAAMYRLRTGVAYLAVNEYVLTTGIVGVRPLRGWTNSNWRTAIVDETNRLVIESLHMDSRDGGSIVYILGTVRLPDVERIVVRTFHEDTGQMKEFCTIYKEDYLETESGTYFWVRRENWQYEWKEQWQAVAYDKAGTVIEQYTSMR